MSGDFNLSRRTYLGSLESVHNDNRCNQSKDVTDQAVVEIRLGEVPLAFRLPTFAGFASPEVHVVIKSQTQGNEDTCK